MSDFEIFVERLHSSSTDNASTWDMLRLFQENDFDPSLAMHALRASRDQEIRVDAAGFYRDKDDPNRKIKDITDEQLDEIAKLIRNETEVVTLPVSNEHRIALREALRRILQARGEAALIENVANAYAKARPKLSKDMSFVALQNDLRLNEGMPLFSIGLFLDDIREFLSGSIWHDRNSDPFFAGSVLRNICFIVLSNPSEDA